MQITIDALGQLPIYRQISDAIEREIKRGNLAPGTKLPTVRELAAQLCASKGTVKHAYDRLEQLEYIEMTQGRGTFVKSADDGSTKKERAIALIDSLIGELEDLRFSPREIRIFFDMRMREREEGRMSIRVGIVDCNPETLLMIANQVKGIENVDITQYLLENVIQRQGVLDETLDLFITTSTHMYDMMPRVPDPHNLMPVALETSAETAAALAQLPEGAAVGMVCSSERFSVIMQRGYKKYSQTPMPAVFLLGRDQGLEQFLDSMDAIILPANWESLSNTAQIATLKRYIGQKKCILYGYQVDRGSILYIEEQIRRLYAQRVQK